MAASKCLQPSKDEKEYATQKRLDADLRKITRQEKTLSVIVKGLKTGGKNEKQQARLITCLVSEHIDVLTDYANVASTTTKKTDCKLMNTLIGLLDEHSNHKVSIEKKKSDMKAINDDINEIKKKIIALKAKALTERMCTERIVNGQQNLRRLENKLEMANKQRCMIVTESNKLREVITHLLTERKSFNKLWYTYISNLHKGKQIMMDIVEQATIAYNHRDEWVHKLETLRSLAYDDFLNHCMDMESFQRLLDHNYNIERFMSVKGQRRSLIKLEMKKIKKQQQIRQDMTSSLAKHKKTLSLIKNFMNIDVSADQNGFINMFSILEQQNLGYFRYITDLHKDIEDLTVMVISSHENIDKQNEITRERVLKQKETLKSLKNLSKVAKLEADVEMLKLNETNKTLAKIYKGITSIYQICKCSKASFQSLLGNNVKINDYNVFLFFKVLEDTVDNLLVNVYSKQKTGVKKASAKQPERVIKEGLKPYTLFDSSVGIKTPCPLCVDRELVNDLVDTLQVVKTKEQTRTLLNEDLKVPEKLERLHNVSACNLPKSREIIQKRYQ